MGSMEIVFWYKSGDYMEEIRIPVYNYIYHNDNKITFEISGYDRHKLDLIQREIKNARFKSPMYFPKGDPDTNCDWFSATVNNVYFCGDTNIELQIS